MEPDIILDEHEWQRIKAQLAAAEKLAEANRTLIQKMEEVTNSNDWNAVWSLFFAHGGKYQGGNWGTEYTNLRSALTLWDNARSTK